MPKKTKKQKILAAYRRKLQLLENQSFEQKTLLSNKKNHSINLTEEKNNLVKESNNNNKNKVMLETSQDQIIKKLFIQDFLKSFLLIILIIGLIVGLYLLKIF